MLEKIRMASLSSEASSAYRSMDDSFRRHFQLMLFREYERYRQEVSFDPALNVHVYRAAMELLGEHIYLSVMMGEKGDELVVLLKDFYVGASKDDARRVYQERKEKE